MAKLAPPDTHHYSAAEGWLELGLPKDASEEWNRLSPAARLHPAALELRWRICIELQDWDRGVEIGDELIVLLPDSAAGWLHRAYAMRRATRGGLQNAWDALHPAADKFPQDETVAYNLSCYATQLGRLDEGWEWFLRALMISKDSGRVRRFGLRDDDLRPLWERIRGLK